MTVHLLSKLARVLPLFSARKNFHRFCLLASCGKLTQTWCETLALRKIARLASEGERSSYSPVFLARTRSTAHETFGTDAKARRRPVVSRLNSPCGKTVNPVWVCASRSLSFLLLITSRLGRIPARVS